MNTTIRNTALASILFAAASSAAFAADTADLKVTGTIKPAACAVTLSGNGIVDFGTISARDLSDTAYTALTTKNVKTTVTCDSSTKIALKVGDNRAGTATATDYKFWGYYSAAANFGFGEASGKKLGGYALRLSPYSTIDGALADNGRTLTSTDSGKTWKNSTDTKYLRGDGSVLASIAASGSTAPGEAKVFVFEFDVYGAIESKANLPALTSDISLDGNTTFSIVYL
ncbi:MULTISPECIES: DUF1120 domain-containing protein [unclassified Cupriavidus]|uniref:DUF1120 domain-containing protein n=1 Tax=unclassified Cupriavidus TaxID=2640874 RepID=UPI00313F0AA3